MRNVARHRRSNRAASPDPDPVLLVGLALNFLVTMRLLGQISHDRESPLGTINL